MPKTQTTVIPSATTKTHRGARSVSKKSAAPARTPAIVFDAVTHHEEIAQEAYLIWLARAEESGSPERDWCNAEIAVRARYGV